jgi:hypothetical protein
VTPPFLQAAQSDHSEPSAAYADLQSQLRGSEPSLLLIFCGSVALLAELTTRFNGHYPSATVVGCTTCGEIGAQKCGHESAVAMAIGAPLRAAAKLIPDMPSFRFEDGAILLHGLAADLGTDFEHIKKRAKDRVLLTLTDGLSGLEDLLTASLVHCVPKLDLVGGGAGDNFRFEATHVAVNGELAMNGAVVLLLEPNVPFHPFRLHHFKPTGQSFVVTDADPLRRWIMKLDGYPATEVIAGLLQVSEADFIKDPHKYLGRRPMVFGFHAGAEMYLRSVMTVADGNLLMGGAIESGTVFHLMEPDELVANTKRDLDKAIQRVPGALGQILFNCGGRLLETMNGQCTEEFGQALCPISTVGFSTYGEQFGPMQVNHTLTGLILGAPDG